MSEYIVETVETDTKKLQLQRKNGHYEIISNGIFLMATHGGDSEQEMVKDALFYVNTQKLENLKVLIAGLGVGYSIIPAVNDHRVDKVDVIELEPEIIEWNKYYFSYHNQNIIFSDKVTIYNEDILDFLKQTQEEYDVLVLDVDNGPDWLVYEENTEVYQLGGLSKVIQCMSSQGITAVWSMTDNSNLEASLVSTFGPVTMRSYKTIDNKGREHNDYVYFAGAAS